MTIITKGMGAIIKKLSKKVHKNIKTGKPFPASTQKHMRSQEIRHHGMKTAGYEGPKYRPVIKGKGPHELHEVWKYNPYKKRGKK